MAARIYRGDRSRSEDFGERGDILIGERGMLD